MHGDFVLLEKRGEIARAAARLPFGETYGRNEAWLRDTLFGHPDVLPVGDIDDAFAPLLPLCRELRTEAGPVDIAFINPAGRLTLVECKLWRNPEARRKVVAQVLDYARAISRWSYSDLQRQVSMATGRKGNVPFDLARTRDPSLGEHRFADSVSRFLRAGRFLLLVAGDGIREDVISLAEIVNRNALCGFSLGLIEVALYDLGNDELAVQPRTIVRTHVIERSVMVLQNEGGTLAWAEGASPATEALGTEEPASNGANASPDRRAEFREWWQSILGMRFDDPDQDQPKLYFPNNVRMALPWRHLHLSAYRAADDCGVFLSGPPEEYGELFRQLGVELDRLLAELPEGTMLDRPGEPARVAIVTSRPNATFASDAAKRDWLRTTLNAYVNALRPRLKRLAQGQAVA